MGRSLPPCSMSTHSPRRGDAASAAAAPASEGGGPVAGVARSVAVSTGVSTDGPTQPAASTRKTPTPTHAEPRRSLDTRMILPWLRGSTLVILKYWSNTVFHHNAFMTRETLLDFFDERLRSDAEFFVHDNGYRIRHYSYAAVRRAAVDFAARLAAAGVGAGDKVLFWSENRPEWIMAFWGCLLRGVVVVPIDHRASAGFLHTVRQLVDARVLLVGDEAEPPADPGLDVWRLAELSETAGAPAPPMPVGHTPARDDIAEIIFTSGATSEPKGVIITHRNVLANIVPVEREVLTYRKFGRPFYPLRFLNLLPLSHMFGQSLATFIPPMLPGVCVFMRGYSPSAIVHQIHSRRVSVLVCVPKILDVLRKHVLQIAPEVADTPADNLHVVRRWWRYRRIHRLFGDEVLVLHRRRSAARPRARSVLVSDGVPGGAGLWPDRNSADRHAQPSVQDATRHGRHTDRRCRGQESERRRDPRERRQRHHRLLRHRGGRGGDAQQRLVPHRRPRHDRRGGSTASARAEEGGHRDVGGAQRLPRRR